MLDWYNWLNRWDMQQTRYIPDREARFEVMLDTCADVLPEDFVALDLACGPGAISRRLLSRFPHVRVIALDYNPILIHLGQQTLDIGSERLRWIKVNLATPNWLESLRSVLDQYGRTHVDAVLTTTAMHWLAADALTRVYSDLGDVVREGGVYLNGDHLAYPPHLPVFRRLAQQAKTRQQDIAFAQPGSENYAQWWAALLNKLRTYSPTYDELIDEYERNEADRARGVSEPIMALHEAALLNAGFTQISTIWQHWDDRVLLAVKGAPTDTISN
jgi:SAM-dependent methyltransferase